MMGDGDSAGGGGRSGSGSGLGLGSGFMEARRVSVRLAGREVLSEASLLVRAGEVCCVTGPSGGGKTTLLRVLATLVEPAAGEVLLDGVPAHSLTPRDFRVRVAYVAQQPVMFPGNVRHNVKMGPTLRGQSLDDSAVAALLERVGLAATFATRPATELSGGERQRVAIARALANQPSMLLLDEPTSALDAEAAARILDLIRRCATDGLGVVVVSHIAEHLAALAGTRYLCSAGRLQPA